MSKDIRIREIEKIVDRDKNRKDLLTHEIMWDKKLIPEKVFNIPLTHLVYNKYNGRILSRTKSLEKQNQIINVETDEGRNIIEKLLWESKIDRNKKTESSIRISGQQKVGIITKDGVIIDGNRRAMLLNKIDRTGFFKAIVLPVTLEENPIEIERLETTYQMGEDEKLGYNPIEKYLKAKQIFEKLTPAISVDEALKSISDWMGESDGEIKKYLDTMSVMDEYLEYLDYDGIYTQLDSREDQFLSLNKWLSTFYNKESNKAGWGYNNDDVDELKTIAFDYLRFRNEYDGKEFRNLAEGNKDKHFFGDKEIWKSFSAKHNEIISLLPEESKIDINSKNLEKHLNARDNSFFENSKFENGSSAFIENLNDHKYLVGYNKASEEPEKLIKRASQTFDAIKTGHSSFSKTEVQNLIKEFAEKINYSIQKQSPKNALDIVINSLNKIEFEKIKKEEVNEIQNQLEEIRKICFDLKKKI